MHAQHWVFCQFVSDVWLIYWYTVRDDLYTRLSSLCVVFWTEHLALLHAMNDIYAAVSIYKRLKNHNFSSFTNQVCDRISNLVNKLMRNDTGHSLFVDGGRLIFIEQQVGFSVSDQAPVLHRSGPKVWDCYFICNRDRIYPMFFHHNNHCIDRQDMNQLIRYDRTHQSLSILWDHDVYSCFKLYKGQWQIRVSANLPSFSIEYSMSKYSSK